MFMQRSQMKKRLKNVAIFGIGILVLGADCELERLEKMDRGFLKTDDGIELVSMVLPWEVVGDSSTIEHTDMFDNVIGEMNSWFSPLVVFEGGIDGERFVELGDLPSSERDGIILVWVGALPEPYWDEPGPGGVADLTWNEFGEILRCDVVIDAEHAYDAQTFRSRLIHELGHCLGLAHDESSIDLDSCMASPPLVTCSITRRDVERVRGS